MFDALRECLDKGERKEAAISFKKTEWITILRHLKRRNVFLLQGTCIDGSNCRMVCCCEPTSDLP